MTSAEETEAEAMIASNASTDDEDEERIWKEMRVFKERKSEGRRKHDGLKLDGDCA